MSIRMDSREKVLFQMVFFLMLCWFFTGTATAQPRTEGVESVQTRREPNTLTRGSSFDKYDNLKIVASIGNLGSNRYEIVLDDHDARGRVRFHVVDFSG